MTPPNTQQTVEQTPPTHERDTCANSPFDGQNASQEAFAIQNETIVNNLLEPFSLIAEHIFKGTAITSQHFPLLLNEVARNDSSPEGLQQLQQQIDSVLEHILNIHDVDHTTENTSFIDIKAEEGSNSIKRPLKILFVCGYFPCVEHGGGLRLFDIIKALSAHHEIDLYSHYSPELDEESFALLQNSINSYKLVGLDDFKTVQDISTWLKEKNKDQGYYDVIQLEYPPTVGLINALKPFGSKVGYTFMECQTKSYSLYLNNLITKNSLQTIGKYTNIFWQHLVSEKSALDIADFCIAVTPEDAETLSKLSPAKPAIIPTCLSDHEIIGTIDNYVDIQPEEYSASFVGYFDHYPNLDGMEWYLREIHPIIIQQIPNFSLHIIGRGNTTRLEQICGNDPSVNIIGRVDNIIPHVLTAAIAICPLVSGAGIRGKVNQYSAMGRATVTTSIGNNGLPYTHNQSILIADKPQGFAEQMIRLLIDNHLRKKIEENAKQIALENFTWKRYIDQLLTIYRYQN